MGIPALKSRGNRFCRMSLAEYRSIGREDDLRAAVVQWLTIKGICASITDSGLFVVEGERVGRSASVDGWPDISGCLPSGRFLGIELKSKGGKLRPAQTVILERLRASGALIVIAKSLEEVVRAIEKELLRPARLDQDRAPID
jgi:hypothetical protein